MSKKRSLILLIALITGISTSAQASTPPVISVNQHGALQKGEVTGICWKNRGESEKECGDSDFPNPSTTVTVERGAKFDFTIISDNLPEQVNVAINTPDAKQSSHVTFKGIKNSHLSFTPNWSEGIYIVIISGKWPEGTVSYAFKVNVTPSQLHP